MNSFGIIGRWRFSLACALILFTSFSSRAATNVVTTLADSGPGSLRQAISNAAPGDTITFSAIGTISLTTGELIIKKNLNIIGRGTNSLTLSGSGVSRIFNLTNGVTLNISDVTIRDGRTPDGADGFCCDIFGSPAYVENGTPGGSSSNGAAIYNRGILPLSNCVFTANQTGNGGNGGNGGRPSAPPPPEPFNFANGGNGGNSGFGGTIYNIGNLVLLKCVFTGNSTGNGGQGGQGGTATYPPNAHNGADGSSGGGGCIWSDSGSVSAIQCVFTGNFSGTSGGSGGAIGGYAVLTSSSCTFSGNHAGSSAYASGGNGGAIYVSSSNTVFAGCTFAQNYTFSQSGNGGAINALTSLIASNCTFSGNACYGSSGLGGAISAGLLKLISCTVVSNLSYGFFGFGGVYAATNSVFQNCIVSDNNAPLGSLNTWNTCCFVSQGTNLISADDIRIGPLTNNGGPTLTHALLPGSPAIDAGDDTITGTDQRGFSRLYGAHVDIGAFEYGTSFPIIPVAPTLSGFRRVSPIAYQFHFNNPSNVTFRVIATTNVGLPRALWTNLGPATLVSNDVYQFNDHLLPTTNSARFYQLRWP